ncbi:4-coumarate:coa ligase-like protein [Leptomonas pyrrhocoris]|uniref:4-coumarate:coa ligase-like protein n=1 Tax=Leptomonas pyrrhocoris TaxID=157538 RepID=A0A0M9G5X6_LEPPY|nr:4-coumarate:coa ligase-like protein [Leptomonas pyrrhocoris]XP_015661298.1 4-coumarate:coa ligase-like protein [Leptomonas pyrrhocoris]XP_015661299.1 4-coumarate:coa ligase-like protein [Leptomonas pyrrhocoris]KPA82858.1 4-coumarate:coa ligase-like protein [Leptomonas pyrrhocoris]KPA82859.1 4-coumarate:coa ligase-like protein [Leptomonas pyrrhocoris]KPA82860.1 4-coumarate:coa ligase-like protein [Leptomonas pyrrhocoris]|eukprot:XP_015661297.1 4-coumarate:coa ligase-like protein [Leptomonas pyrrhocoris]
MFRSSWVALSATGRSRAMLRAAGLLGSSSILSVNSSAPSFFSAPLHQQFRWTSGSQSHLIYKSKLPSVMAVVNKETTLYGYLMKRMAAMDPKKIAAVQVETGKTYSYLQLMQATEYTAMALYQQGVRKGDVVCLCLLNTAVYGPLVYGALRLGAIVSPVNAVAAASTLAYHFKTNQCKIVFGMRFFQKQLDEAVDLVQRETGRVIKIMYPEEFLKTTDIPPIPKDYDGLKGATLDDTALIPFSSGTMGLPKGVQLTNRALIANVEQTAQAQQLNSQTVSLAILPMFHILGFTVCLNSILAYGGMLVVMSKFAIDEYVKAAAKYRATVNMVAPPILISLMKNKELVQQHDLSSLTCLFSGAAPLGPEVIQMVEAMLPGTTVAQGYGMTEMSPCVTGPVKGQRSTLGSCGFIMADTEIRVVKVDDSQQSGADKSAGIDVQAGEEGEIWVRGPQLMKGYLRDEDTAMCMQDGWFRTGDIGNILLNTEELMITDRLKELIKYKGFQVSPAGLEALLLSHPWVKDCIVFGVPDPRDVSFENPRALVVLQPDVPTKDAVRASDELYRFVMSRMPPHKRLHGGVRIVDEISRNAAGKLMRRQMRQEELAMMKASMEQVHGADSAAT